MKNRLLIVDDEPNLLRALAVVLRGEEFDVTTARNAREGLICVAKSIPDLIVSDVGMPGMDGFQFARKLRASPHTALVPIIFLTAKHETEDRIEGFESGIDAYLTKPFEPDELVAIIKSILRRVERTRSTIARLVGNEEDNQPIVYARDEQLTDAEWRIAEAVAEGLSNKEIAARLNLSIRTVENHVSRILSKKNFSNRVEIARHILSNTNE